MTLLEAKITAGVIIYKDGKVLAIKGIKDDGFDIPKGNKDKKETSKDAAVRETKEETGLKIDKSDLRKLGNYTFGDHAKKTLKLYLYDISNKNIDLNGLKSKNKISFKGNRYPEKDTFEWKELSQSKDFSLKLREIIKKVSHKI